MRFYAGLDLDFINRLWQQLAIDQAAGRIQRYLSLKQPSSAIPSGPYRSTPHPQELSVRDSSLTLLKSSGLVCNPASQWHNYCEWVQAWKAGAPHDQQDALAGDQAQAGFRACMADARTSAPKTHGFDILVDGH